MNKKVVVNFKKEFLKYWKNLPLPLKILIIGNILILIIFLIIYIISGFANSYNISTNAILNLVITFFALGIMVAGVSLVIGGLKNSGLI